MDANLLLLEQLASERKHWCDNIKLYRQYTAGQGVYAFLNSDQEALLNRNPYYHLNVSPMILKAKANRLKILGFDITNEAEEADSDSLLLVNEIVSEWLEQLEFTLLAADAHFIAPRDGDAYLLVEYDEQLGRPKMTIETAFDGEYGVLIHYRNKQATHASRRWCEQYVVDGKVETLQRMNCYYPDRIERFYSITSGAYVQAGWQPYSADGYAPIIPYVDGIGQPLGLPVFHLCNAAWGDDYGTSDLQQVVPYLQDALNVAGVSVLSAAQLAGFPVNYITGQAQPTQGGSYAMYAGSILTLFGGQGGYTVGQLPAANLMQLIEVKSAFLRDISMITDTPLSYLNSTGQIAAEGTLQQQEAPLLAKVERAQADFGGTWELAIAYMIKLDQTYNPASLIPNGTFKASIQWGNPQTRSELMDAQTLQIHQALGVPEEIIWKKLGYSPDEIADMKRIKSGEVINAIQQLQTQTAQKLMNAPDLTGAIGATTNEQASMVNPTSNPRGDQANNGNATR